MRMSRPNSPVTIGKISGARKYSWSAMHPSQSRRKKVTLVATPGFRAAENRISVPRRLRGHHDPGIRRLSVLDLLSDFLGQPLLVRGQWLIAERSAEDRHLEPGFVVHPGDAGRELQPPENPIIGVGVVTRHRIRWKAKRDGNVGFHRGRSAAGSPATRRSSCQTMLSELDRSSPLPRVTRRMQLSDDVETLPPAGCWRGREPCRSGCARSRRNAGKLEPRHAVFSIAEGGTDGPHHEADADQREQEGEERGRLSFLNGGAHREKRRRKADQVPEGRRRPRR